MATPLRFVSEPLISVGANHTGTVASMTIGLNPYITGRSFFPTDHDAFAMICLSLLWFLVDRVRSKSLVSHFHSTTIPKIPRSFMVFSSYSFESAGPLTLPLFHFFIFGCWPALSKERLTLSPPKSTAS